jgi:hypothetical protein
MIPPEGVVDRRSLLGDWAADESNDVKMTITGNDEWAAYIDSTR